MDMTRVKRQKRQEKSDEGDKVVANGRKGGGERGEYK